jgi:hypothetical protein
VTAGACGARVTGLDATRGAFMTKGLTTFTAINPFRCSPDRI